MSLTSATRGNVPLIVDEAHGGHFCFLPEGAPKSALASGADLAVQSCHKTLGSLVGSAQLHVSRNSLVHRRKGTARVKLSPNDQPELSAARVARCDAALACGEKARRCLPRPSRKRSNWQLRSMRLRGLKCFESRIDARLADYRQDPLRLVVNVRETGWSGYEVERFLRTEFQVEDEMADWFNVVYIFEPAR